MLVMKYLNYQREYATPKEVNGRTCMNYLMMRPYDGRTYYISTKVGDFGKATTKKTA